MEDYQHDEQFEGDDHVAASLEDTQKDVNGAGALSSEEVEIANSPGHEPKNENKEGDRRIRVCDFCGKGFNSGKALGGHRRIHLNPGVPKRLKKLKSSITHEQDSTRSVLKSDGEKFTCFVCEKDFPSMKSLSGHMRFHPGRDWRGIKPPPSSSSSLSVEKETTFLDHVTGREEEKEEEDDYFASETETNLLRCLPNWSKTDIRGRRSRSGPSFQADGNLMTRLLDPAFQAIESLMILARIGLKDPDHLLDEQVEDGGDDNYRVLSRNFAPKKRMRDESSSVENKSNHQSKRLKIDEIGFWRSAAKSDKSDNFETIAKMMAEKKMNMIWKPKLKASEAQAQKQIMSRKPNEFKCSTCDKTFPTFQALGGHRSSHNKYKNSQAIEQSAAKEGKKYANAIIPTVLQYEETEEFGEDASLYQCNICYKTFPTGQALGGHKKSHWIGGPLTEDPSGAVKSEAAAGPSTPPMVPLPLHEEADDQTGGKMLGFDLNEPYIED